ncbi:MAG: transposase, family [Mycobacterium sp.]|jgi:IS30 family transposase|nr:transposase, family [Mycobacterium sp.]
MGFRKYGSKEVPKSAHEEVLAALSLGLSPAAAATVAGVSATTGYVWARAAGWKAGGGHTGIRYSAAVREAFWAAMTSGSSTAQAAQIAGVSEMSANIWVKQAGYVPRTQFPAVLVTVSCRRPRAPMSFVERCRLEDLLESGYTAVRAAELLKRHHTTIRREIVKGLTCSGYRAWKGQDVAEANRRRPKGRKLKDNPVLLAEVLKGLKTRHSPEQIAGRLKLDFPEDPEMWVSHETIYQALYVQPRGELASLVKDALRTGRTQRKRQGRNEIADRQRFKDGMVNISERPAEAEDRAIPGHWEGDLILGSTASHSAIATMVERTTGFVVLLHMPEDRTAATLAAAMSIKVPEIPEILRRSLTWDQGSEMALHTKITQATGLPIYFCDPHSPWQRGTNENTNGLLRQYFPKGTDLSFYGPGWLDQVAAELNARPRKRLGFRTPAEELDRLLSDPSAFVAATA